MSSSSQEDQDCANLARAALFPKRMHRDVADASHFPALLQLDLLRNQVLSSTPNASISSVFPRHVLVVRNLADGGTQWNGEPDLDDDGAQSSFQVIPDRLSVTCSSRQCKDLVSSQRAFRRTIRGEEEEIVLCSDRILKPDSQDKRYKGVARELPPKSYQAVEEVLAHQLVQVRSNIHDNNAAKVQLDAAKAAECYFSRHAYEGTMQVKKGSRLQTGYSWLPSFAQNWSMNKCLSAVAMEQLVAQKLCQNKQDAKEAVQAALKKNQEQQ
ncbi:expressed unknown protein [Seminavis robusta]|uniref:Uncharacterized protein n=1 Tax=Seminavis robusta TaxID=568900 RepID=A0A9N8DKY5_9STRA|nr:expressed unknown protein [Seminavis robusta]|eukprot:Sro186_g080740.1 n/a (269) ;mRNA; r:69364-70170